MRNEETAIQSPRVMPMILAHQAAKEFLVRILHGQIFLPLIRLITTLTMISLSSGLLSAINKVNATRALSAMRFSPSALYRKFWRSKNQTKIAAAIRLLPSVNEWF